MEDPELITIIPEEEVEYSQPPPTSHLGKRLMIQIVAVVALKVATGFAIRSLAKTIKEFDVLYPEHLDDISWKDRP